MKLQFLLFHTTELNLNFPPTHNKLPLESVLLLRGQLFSNHRSSLIQIASKQTKPCIETADSYINRRFPGNFHPQQSNYNYSNYQHMEKEEERAGRRRWGGGVATTESRGSRNRKGLKWSRLYKWQMSFHKGTASDNNGLPSSLIFYVHVSNGNWLQKNARPPPFRSAVDENVDSKSTAMTWIGQLPMKFVMRQNSVHLNGHFL